MSAERGKLWEVPDSDLDAHRQLIDKSIPEIPPDRTQKANSSTRWKFIFLIVFFIAITATAVYLLSHHHSREDDILTCGTTNEEAISRGCIIEPMVYGWMPEPCYFPSLSSQYTPFTDRTWYISESFPEDGIVPPEDIWAAKHEYIFAHSYHSEHCLFLWRKLSLGIQMKSEWIDTKTLDAKHADHCVDEILYGGIEGSNSSAQVQLGFYTCVRMPWKRRGFWTF